MQPQPSPTVQGVEQPMGAMQPVTDPHAGHQMGTAPSEIPAPPVAPPPPEALAGPAHAADRVFGEDQMAEARQAERQEHGGTTNHRFLVDQLEVSFRDGREGYSWDDAQFWYGGDIDKLWIKSQGEGTFAEGVERVEVQALWSHAINPWFDLQAGVRYDFRPDPRRAYLVLGIQGLAPYWFEIDGALFLSNEGDLSARFEAEYDLRITQMLILQPRFEVDFSLQDVPELGIGSGLSTAEPGLRLRYEFVPEFAPYVGVQYERAFGDTARFRSIAGESVGGWSLVLGVRAWF
jgi:copper resistance protein B